MSENTSSYVVGSKKALWRNSKGGKLVVVAVSDSMQNRFELEGAEELWKDLDL